jgi:hypothetical protein
MSATLRTVERRWDERSEAQRRRRDGSLTPKALTTGHALAGFIEAEGSFEIRPNNGGNSWICGMALTQRADDADMRRPTTFSTGTPDSFVTFGVMSTSGTRRSRQSPKRPV